MAYNGGRGANVNVSEYINQLNTIPTAQDAESLPFDDDLAMFTNTEWFDYDLQQNLDAGRNDDQTAEALPADTFDFGQGEQREISHVFWSRWFRWTLLMVSLTYFGCFLQLSFHCSHMHRKLSFANTPPATPPCLSLPIKGMSSFSYWHAILHTSTTPLKLFAELCIETLDPSLRSFTFLDSSRTSAECQHQ